MGDGLPSVTKEECAMVKPSVLKASGKGV